MFKDTLVKIGLTPDQALIYESMLKSGALPASRIALNVGIKRGLGYKVIEQLIVLGLVEKVGKAISLFKVTHPTKLKELAENRAKEFETNQSALHGILGSMVSAYNLGQGKPNIQFYEGEEGIKKVLEDSLYSQEEICSYADITTIQKYAAKTNAWYVEKREKKGIKKRGILLDTPEARAILKSYNQTVTNTRLIKIESAPFESVTNIYDGKVAHITLTGDQMIGIIIEDQSLYKMQKALFDFTWSKAEILE